MRPPRRPRWVNRLWAWALGYFWIPCPRCGRPFGGHEADGDPVPKAGLASRLSCWRCIVPTDQLVAEQEAAWGIAIIDYKRWLGVGR